MTPYIGNAPYCYANATAMLLACHGEAIDAGTIECLTGVGIGARWWRRDEAIYFSVVPPDVGVSRALALLGFDFIEEVGGDGAPPPYAEIRARLATGPVMIGPLDMVHLSYLPNARDLAGVDHYVLLTQLFDDHARLHDPYGYPNVRLELDDLARAWEARAVSYRRAPYRYWAKPSRIASPGESDLRRAAIAAFRSTYAASGSTPPTEDILIGPAAYEAAACRIRKGEADALLGLLKHFGLPLGARRAHDLALFLRSGDASLADLKREQSEAFIDGYRHVIDGEIARVADSILMIGDLDERFGRRLRAS
ncbi:MAG: hypothetical protein ACE5H8_12035 [Alphaproteobacteria bacterium]